MNQQVVLRLAERYLDLIPGIGLHCYHYARLSRRRSIVVTKYIDSIAYLPRDDTKIIEIEYNDRPAKHMKLSLLDYLIIGSTKIYGEVRMLIGALKTLSRTRTKPSIIHIHSANYLIAGLILKYFFRVPACLNCGSSEVLRAPKIPIYRQLFRLLDIAFYVSRDMEKGLHSMMPSE